MFDIVVIGTSTGGLKALRLLLSGLPADFPVPIAVVQHRGKDSDNGLAEFLGEFSALSIVEPDDKEPLVAGRVYLAPRDYHLLIENRSFALSTASPVRFARPSIDVLFESAADEFQTGVIGVILTGANSDGARGAAAIKSRGGVTIVEDAVSAACPELPEAAIAQATPNHILPLHQIAACLIALIESRQQSELLRQGAAEPAIYYGR